ncbi:STAS domain-containing protein [Mechercharimyces sp. CAU 1602]|uniref:STAS domain-containing protein n=1 Tax=Mechercharimyces sp. CAU 1602 TaxID=2973933 RepID=UPI0021612080|nr:STAS domain-containing protein [Mechercharimyces sp. CAU 1602]MCS1352137.1 STAS domain-containing protein [Mechercharimyces sp. CAU 1602]
MNVSIEERSGIDTGSVLVIRGEIDVYTAPALRDKVMPLTKKEDHITLDLSGVDYIDSTGLGVLIGAYKALRVKDGQLTLVGVGSRLYRLLEITGLSEIFTIHQGEKEGREG